MGGDVGWKSDEAENFWQKDKKDRTPENTLVIGETSENDDRENENGFIEAEGRWVDERDVSRKKCARNRSHAGGKDENEHFVDRGVVAENGNGLLVLANRLEHAPKRRIDDVARDEIHNPRDECRENEEADV